MFKKSFLILILSLFLAFPILAYDFNENSGLNSTAEKAGYEEGEERNLEGTIANGINIVLSLVGVLFIGLMLYGGYNWMTAGGNEEKVKTAKGTVTEASIGLIIVIAAYAVSYFALDFILEYTLEN